MITTQLDAVNLVLRKLGEPPIITLDTQYPTLDLIFPALDEARIDLLLEGWWFNTFAPVMLMPGENSEVPVPPDTLVFYPDEPEKYLFAGSRIVRLDGSPLVGVPVRGSRIVDAQFEQLPTAARTCVAYNAALNVYGADVGMDSIFEGIRDSYMLAYRELSRTHTRQRQYSMRRKRQYLRWKSMLRS